MVIHHLLHFCLGELSCLRHRAAGVVSCLGCNFVRPGRHVPVHGSDVVGDCGGYLRRSLLVVFLEATQQNPLRRC